MSNIRRKVGVSHRHLDRLVTHEFLNGFEWCANGNEVAREEVLAKAMGAHPRVQGGPAERPGDLVVGLALRETIQQSLLRGGEGAALVREATERLSQQNLPVGGRHIGRGLVRRLVQGREALVRLPTLLNGFYKARERTAYNAVRCVFGDTLLLSLTYTPQGV